MMDEKTILDRACDALRAGGAEGDAWLENRRRLHLLVREGKLEELQRAEVRGLGIRAMSGGKLGFVYTSECDPEGAARAAAKACELAKSGSARDDLVLAERKGPGDGSDEGEALGIYDPSIERKTIAEKQEWARSVESVARGVDPKIRRTEGSNYDEDLASVWLSNTKGLYRHYTKSGLEVGVQVVAEDQGEMQQGEIGHETGRWDSLPDPGDFGRRSADRALRLLGGRPVATGRYPIVFSPDAGFAVLVYLAAALGGDAMSRGRSWLSGRSGEITVGSPLVTIHDDGRLQNGPASLPFDGEGSDTQDNLLIDGGKVHGSLRDLAAGKRLGLPSSGGSRREGYESLPHISNSNLYLTPGTAKPGDLIAGVEKGLWVWGLSGWWIGLDPSNPTLSTAAYGLWIEKGKSAQPVARVTVAGTVQEILGGVDAVADDLVWDHPTKTPTFRVKALAVSGT
jgi:PmbA protein